MKKPTETQGLRKIKGILIAADWNENGAVTAVALCTPKEEEYFIEESSPCWKDLLTMMQQEVELEGRFEKGLQGERRFWVDRFTRPEPSKILPLDAWGIRLWKKEISSCES